METHLDPDKIIIIDHGAHSIRIGLSNADSPQIIMSSIVGTKRKTMSQAPGMLRTASSSNSSPNEASFGEEALEISHLLRMETTMEDRNNIKEFAKALYTKVFTDMGIIENLNNNNHYSVVFIVSSFVDKNFIERASELLLTSFGFPRIFLVPQALLYFNNIEKGILVDIGETTTDVVYVDGNKIVKKMSSQLNIGMKDIVTYLKELYDDNEYFKFNSILQIQKFAENNVSVNPDEEMPQSTTTIIPLTIEDSTYNFGVELLKAGEILLKPEIVKKDCLGLSSAVSGILSSENEKIIIVGGGSKIPNLKARMIQDISTKSSNTPNIVDASYDTTLSNWILAREFAMNRLDIDSFVSSLNYSKFTSMFTD